VFGLTRLRRLASELLGTEVDIVTREALRSEMREAIPREAVRAV